MLMQYIANETMTAYNKSCERLSEKEDITRYEHELDDILEKMQNKYDTEYDDTLQF